MRALLGVLLISFGILVEVHCSAILPLENEGREKMRIPSRLDRTDEAEILPEEWTTFSRILAMLNRIRARPQKRNFDELDRSRFGAFYKRNFDQVDGAGFGTLSRYF